MKLLALFAVLVVICATSADEIVDREWEYYKLTYNKNYSSAEDEAFRKKIFTEKFYKIVEHNKLYEAGESTYSVGYNNFTDWTEEEWDKYLHPFQRT